MSRTFLILGVVATVGVIGMLTTHALARGDSSHCKWRNGSGDQGLCGANGGGLNHGNKLMRLAFELDLSQDQRDQIRDRLKSHMGPLVDAKWNLAEARHELGQTIHGQNVDEKAIRDSASKLGDAIGELAVLKSKTYQSIRTVLTPDQAERFKKLCSHHGKHNRSTNNDDDQSGHGE